jgi:hypothetical protein
MLNMYKFSAYHAGRMGYLLARFAIVCFMVAPAMAQEAGSRGGTGSERDVGPGTAPDKVRVQAPREKPAYATELPKEQLAAEEAAAEEAGREPKPAPAPEERQLELVFPGINAPMLINDINVADYKEFEFGIGFDWSHKGFSVSKSGTRKPLLLNTYEFVYGLAPNLEVGLEVPIVEGDGRVAGNSDIHTYAKYRFWEDKDWYPGFAMIAALRLPTGVESSGVDGWFQYILTKRFGQHRVHLNGITKTANGSNVEDVRHFQWSVAAGYDHPLFDNKTLFIIDYLNTSSEEEGHSNSNYLEFGVQREIVTHHTLGVSMRVGLDDGEETTGFGVGVKYLFSTK